MTNILRQSADYRQAVGQLSKGNVAAGFAELDKLIGARDYKEFLSARNELYRERNMAEHPPSREEALKLMSKTPNLIRRPLLVDGSKIIIGFDEVAYRKLAK